MTWARDVLGADEVFGIDIAWEAMGFYRGRTGRRLAQAFVLALSFPSDSFDLVISQDVLQYPPKEGGEVDAPPASAEDSRQAEN